MKAKKVNLQLFNEKIGTICSMSNIALIRHRREGELRTTSDTTQLFEKERRNAYFKNWTLLKSLVSCFSTKICEKSEHI